MPNYTDAVQKVRNLAKQMRDHEGRTDRNRVIVGCTLATEAEQIANELMTALGERDAARARIAELEGQQGDLRNAVLEYDAAKSEFERLYAENPTMIGDWGDASRRERSSRDLIIKLAHEIAGLASADARGGSDDRS